MTRWAWAVATVTLGSWFKWIRPILVTIALVILVVSFIGWCARRPVQMAVVATFIAAAVQWRSWEVGAVAAGLLAVLAAAGLIAWHARRGSAAGFRAILSGLSRMQHVRREWSLTCRSRKLTAVGDNATAPPLTDMRITQTGVTAVAVMGAVRRDSEELLAVERKLAGPMFCDRVTVKLLTPSAALVRFDWGKHLASIYRLHELPAATKPNRIVYGIRDTAGPAEVLYNRSVLVGGETGSGKSSTILALLYGYLQRFGADCLRVRIYDPHQMDFAPMRLAIDSGSPIVHEYVTEVKELTARDGFWAHIDRAMDARRASLAGVTREHMPTPQEPLDITIVDEMLPIAQEIRARRVDHTAARIVFGGRKLGFVLIGATQLGEKDVLGPIRDLFPLRICHRTPNWHVTDAILREGAHNEGAASHYLDADTDQGVAYTVEEAVRGYGAVRSAYVSTEESQQIAMGVLPVARLGRIMDRECWVYWAWGDHRERPGGPVVARDALLYIGEAYDVAKRFGEHARDDWFWADVTRTWVESEPYPSKELAQTAEALAIKRNGPIHNQEHNMDNPDRVPRRRRTWVRREVEQPREGVDA